jgi:hypothetical protein
MQKNRFNGNTIFLKVQKLIAIDKVFIITLGSSILLHLLFLLLTLNTDLPPPISAVEYSEWVSRIAEPNREAVLAPLEDDVSPSSQDGDSIDEVADKEGAAKKASGAKGSVVPPSGVSGNAGRVGVRQVVSGSGVLGVIGVASEGGGEFADVFSSSGSDASADDGSVMEGKKDDNVVSSGSIARKQLTDGEGDGADSAGIGQIGIAAGGRVQTSKKIAAEIKNAQIQTADANVLSDGLDKKSASAVIAHKRSGFRRCYERGLKKDPTLHGKLLFEISIGDLGDVLEVRFVENTMQSKEVSECIKSILLRLKFSKEKSGIALLRNTLVFEPQQ